MTKNARFVVGYHEPVAGIDAANRVTAVFRGCTHEHLTRESAAACESDGVLIFDRQTKQISFRQVPRPVPKRAMDAISDFFKNEQETNT
jgi:hypothetical protein